MASTPHKDRATGFRCKIYQVNASVQAEHEAGEPSGRGFPPEGGSHEPEPAVVVIAKGRPPSHDPREEQFEQGPVMGRGDGGERRVDLIQQSPFEVGLCLNQEPLTYGSSFVAASLSPEFPGSHQQLDVPVKGAASHTLR